MEDRRSRRDRIAAEEHREPRKLRARDQPDRNGLGSRDGAIKSRLRGRRIDVALRDLTADFGGLAISMAGPKRGDVRLGQLGCLGELGLQPFLDRSLVAIEHPERETQRPHILTAQSLLVAKAEGLHCIKGQLADVERDKLPLGKRAILERIARISRLGEVPGAELAGIGNDKAARFQCGNVHS